MNLIHHLAIICSDKDSALDFYVSKLGFEIIRENYRPERDDWKIDLKLKDEAEIELFIMKGHPERPSPESYGLRHLAFKVEDFDLAIKELEAKGIVCEPVRIDTFTGGRATFFKDPDGLPLEIHE